MTMTITDEMNEKLQAIADMYEKEGVESSERWTSEMVADVLLRLAIEKEMKKLHI